MNEGLGELRVSKTLFYDIGNCSAILCHKNTLRVRMRTRMRGSIASQSCSARQKCASFAVYYNAGVCEAHFCSNKLKLTHLFQNRFLLQPVFPQELPAKSASATRFLSDAVRSPGGFYFIGNEAFYKEKKCASYTLAL